MARLLFIFLFIALCKGNTSKSLKLEQVLILSRHNIRTPLITNLDAYSSHTWPKFNDADGELTQKGALMETYMAEYIAEWLAKTNFIKGCPKKEEVHIYSNTMSRTRATAKSFAEAAFRSCNISSSHNENVEIFDPIFFMIFHNNSDYFIHKVISEMEAKLNGVDLTQSYLELNRILDIENSENCKQKYICDLSKNKTEIYYEEGEEPNVLGPLLWGTQFVDAFAMSYYEGFPLENVAWGKITTEKQWELLTRIIKHNLNVRFSPSASKDVAKPLLTYMFNILKNGTPKFSMLVGHDANLCVIFKALNFKKFNIDNQHEPYPIGGKVFFQKWSDGANKFLKAEYVYPTFSQIRNSEKLSIENPPHKILLALEDCQINDDGFCPWDDFIKLFL